MTAALPLPFFNDNELTLSVRGRRRKRRETFYYMWGEFVWKASSNYASVLPYKKLIATS